MVRTEARVEFARQGGGGDPTTGVATNLAEDDSQEHGEQQVDDHEVDDGAPDPPLVGLNVKVAQDLIAGQQGRAREG